MNRYKLIIYPAMIIPGVLHYFGWIKQASIITGSYETSRLTLVGAESVWTQSGEWHCICITSMSSLHPWIELISIPTVTLLWHSESKIYRCLVISPINHVYIIQCMLQSHFNGIKGHMHYPQGQITDNQRLEKVMSWNESTHFHCYRRRMMVMCLVK